MEYRRRSSVDLTIELLDLAVTRVRADLDDSRRTLLLLLDAYAGISPETLAPARSAGVAVRLSKAFGRAPFRDDGAEPV